MKTYQLTNPQPVSNECDIPLQFKGENRLKAAQKAFRAMSKRIKKLDSSTIPFYFSLAKVGDDDKINQDESYHFEGVKEYTTKGSAKLTIRCFKPKKNNKSQKIQISNQKKDQAGGAEEKEAKEAKGENKPNPYYNSWQYLNNPMALSANNYMFYNPLWYGDIYYTNSFFNGYPFMGLTYPFDFPIVNSYNHSFY